jgi:cytochrome c
VRALLASAVLVAAAHVAATSAASASRGEAVFFKQCAVCHTTAPEFHKEGPSLSGVYGRRAGTAPFFAGYRGLKGASVVWDESTLDAWLADPRAFLDGRDTGMTLRLNEPGERADVIAYLKTLR